MRNIKKTFSMFLSILMILLMITGISVNADTYVVDDIFEIRLESNSECMISDYFGNDTTMVIPEVILNKKVIGIIPHAFNSDDFIQYIEIPETVEVIGCMAFAYSSALKEITIPSNISNIVWGAFREASVLEKVVFEDGLLTTVTEGCFYYCTSLNNVQLSNNITTIESYAFAGCSSLTNIYIPSTVTSIDPTAFSSNPQLTITCDSGSYAEQYCIDNGIPYEIKAEPVDKTELANTIATADEILAKIDYYRPESVSDFQSTYDNAVEVYNNESATEEDVTSAINALNEVINNAVMYSLFGDVDMNDTINIKDATRIQMYVAKYVNLNDVQLFLADADQNGSVAITDATRVQMIVTKLI